MLSNDLDIYTKIIPILNNTITKTGSNEFYNMFDQIIYNLDKLNNNKQIINKITKDKQNKNKIKEILKKFRDNEYSIKWLLDKSDDSIKELYFNYELLNQDKLLSLSNNLSLIFPFFGYIVTIFIFTIMKFYLNINISFVEFMKSSYLSLYQLFDNVSFFIFEENNFKRRLISNILYHFIIIIQFYNLYKNIKTSIDKYNKIQQIIKYYDDYNNLLIIIENIIELDCFTNNNTIKKDLIKLKKYIKKSNLINIGDILYIKKNIQIIEELNSSIIKYIGLIDSYINISDLLDTKLFCLPEYKYYKKPKIRGFNIWHPILKIDQIRNDIELNNSIMIITGPNTSGKSTFMKTVMICVYLSQTIGVVPADYFELTPFNKLFTYMNIPDSIGRESLFEAEMNRCWNYLNFLKESKSNEFIFSIIDELFTGTNPEEGKISSINVCKKIIKYSNSIQMISTHFRVLGNLINEYPDYFINKKFIIKKKDGKLIKNYKLEDGVSNQNLALELLKQKGFEFDIF